jgi:FKBP-type peptidyl-prolyl cis-trans isomerase FklB
MMMKNKTIRFVVFVFAVVTVCQCRTRNEEQDLKPNTQVVMQQAKYDPQDVRIRDIQLSTKADTISLALGVVWAAGVGKVGKNTIAPSFYLGAMDYLYHDQSIMDIYKAEKYLDTRFEKMKYDSAWPPIDMEMKISEIEMMSRFDTASYALGMAWCRGANQQGISEITPALLLGLDKTLLGDSTFFDYRKADAYLWAHIESLRAEKFSGEKFKNEQWLANNKKLKDVVTLPSGLQYRILKKGKGRTPGDQDLVKCHYIAKLIDGTEFESTFSDNNGKPMKLFTRASTVAMQEALLIMKEGDTWELYAPYQLAYGSGGMKDHVPPFATVIYHVELISIEGR